MNGEPLIVLTDPPDALAKPTCPRCGATERYRSETFGPVHDVCKTCHHNFKELTVPEVTEDEGAEGW